MPEEPAYLFIPATQGQPRTTRELQRTVRSHAATVSRPGPVSRRRTHTPKLGKGESVIVFNTEPATSIDPGLSPKPGQFDSTPRLFIDILSGQTFSPIAHLATFHKRYLPSIINHYIYNLTIPTPEIDGSSTSPLFRAAWVPIVIHDPLLFQVVVLFAATHYATFAHPSQYHHLSQELLSLKQSALSALIARVQAEQSTPAFSPASSASERTSNGFSDSLIAASAKMASYEAIFGSVPAFHFHMSAVARMLRLRTDLSTLGMNGFLRPLLAFVDVNSAFLLDSSMYLGELGLANDNTMPHHQPFRPRRFDQVIASSSSSSQAHHLDIGPSSRAFAVNLERFLGSVHIERIQSR